MSASLEITQPDSLITLEVALGVPAQDLGTMATQNANDVTITGGSAATMDKIGFETTTERTPDQGEMVWDILDNTVLLGMNGVQQRVGFDQYYRVQASANVTKGQVVMATGAVGASGIITVAPASSIPAIFYIMGVADQNILLGDQGFIKSFGVVRNINTNAFEDGEVLYYNPAVAGGLTNTAPSTPNAVVALCLRKGTNNGQIFVRLTFNEGV
jgi:hypothetical protein